MPKPTYVLLLVGWITACGSDDTQAVEHDAGKDSGSVSDAASDSKTDSPSHADAAPDVVDDSGIALSPISRPLWLGYFKVAGRYGDYTLEATKNAGNSACVFANAGDFDTSVQDPIASTAKAAADLASLDAGIVIAGGTAEISAAVPYWAEVVCLYVSGEATGSSPLDPTPCEQQAAVARAEVQSLGVPNRPILCYFDTDISDDPQGIWHDPVGVDWIGLNGYIGPTAPATADEAITALRTKITAQLARLPPDRTAIVMAQAYDRNGAWTDIPMLEKLQPIYLEQAELDTRIAGIWWFSYSRPGGTLTHPSLRPWHEAVFKANVMGKPSIQVPLP